MEMESFLKEFGKQLKTTRKQMGLSQVTAAQNMRIDYRHYQNIEGGKINFATRHSDQTRQVLQSR